MAQSDDKYAVVALPLPFKFHSGGFDGLTYSIPIELRDRATIGVRVLVPLGKRLATGVLVDITSEAPKDVRLKPITDVLDIAPVFDKSFLEWTKWVASYYLASWGEVLETALPEGLRPATKSKVTVITKPNTEELAAMQRSAPRRAELLQTIAGYENGVYLAHLEKRHKFKGLYSQIFALEQDGFIKIELPFTGITKPKKQKVVLLSDELANDTAAFSAALIEVERAKKQSQVLLKLLQQKQLHPNEPLAQSLLEKQADVTSAVINKLAERGFVKFESREVTPIVHELPLSAEEDDIKNIALTDEQEKAITAISLSISKKEPATYLLHGVTGSGKTEVYIALARKVLDEGGSVLVLVPEISLTPQLIERFKKRLSSDRNIPVAVLHSRMSLADRYRSWKMLASGEARIAIGARSAIFAPLKDLRLIVVDEEHEVTFKQYDSNPRYNARDAAVMRAHLLGATAVLGSATPSLESYYNAEQGKYHLLKLTKRAQDARLPRVEIVDMRSAPRRKEQMAAMSHLSDKLITDMQARIANKEGIVLLQNRRGFSTYIGCSSCGEVIMCPNCSVTLTYHTIGNRLHCHYCGFQNHKPKTCPECGSEKLYEAGVGTQRVEDELLQELPDATVIRMDLDTTARKGAYEKILGAFGNGDADILLGTQMVAKGLDFPRVTLVGVISADTSLTLPDFRSGERTFQLLTQVSGRAGRKDLEGEVIVQTMQPEHEAILLAKDHNYEGFYKYELPMRKELRYPPFSRLILIEFKGKSEQSVRERAFAFATLFPASASYYERLGPSEPVLKKLRGEYRWHILIKNYRDKDASGEKMRRMIAGALEQYQSRFATTAVKVTVDVDVQGVL